MAFFSSHTPALTLRGMTLFLFNSERYDSFLFYSER